MNRIYLNHSLNPDYDLYKENSDRLNTIIKKYDKNFEKEFYDFEGRQMILSDLIEYIFTGRGYYFAVKSREHMADYIKMVLSTVNLLMFYDSITSEIELRKKFLELMEEEGLIMQGEREIIKNIKNCEGTLGVPKKYIQIEEVISNELLQELEDISENEIEELGEKKKKKLKEKIWDDLSNHFDSLLPKTVGGLWHELTVYAFLLKKKAGHIIPLLLIQRFLHGENDPITPPDFLILRNDKSLVGVEVGRKKEIQTGKFSFRTNIPTGTVDTKNSRISDRCPICLNWIPMCPKVIKDFSNPDVEIQKERIKCLEDCDRYSKEKIAAGKCPYTKYSRNRANRKKYTHHKYANGLHYHYQCVLDSVDGSMKEKIIDAEDTPALETHYPYYRGLEVLL